MRWKPWDGRRKISTEELHSKTQDLIISGIEYNSMLEWTAGDILTEWEERCKE